MLSDEFYGETAAHPIPTDIDAVKGLHPRRAVVDLFMWLAMDRAVMKREFADEYRLGILFLKLISFAAHEAILTNFGRL